MPDAVAATAGASLISVIVILTMVMAIPTTDRVKTIHITP